MLPEPFELPEPELPELSELLDPELPEDLELPELDRPEDLELPELLPLDEEPFDRDERPELLTEDFPEFDFLGVLYTFRFLEELDFDRVTFFDSLESFRCLLIILFVAFLDLSELLDLRLTNRFESFEAVFIPLEDPDILVLGEPLSVLDLLAKFLF